VIREEQQMETDDPVRFSEPARRVLLDCGWYAGRSHYPTDVYSKIERRAKVGSGDGVLAEFGGLDISFRDNRNPNIDNVFEVGARLSSFFILQLNVFDLRTIAHLPEPERRTQLLSTNLTDTTMLAQVLGLDCMVIGMLSDSFYDNGVEFVILDASGAVHVQSDDLFQVASNFDMFLNRWIDPDRYDFRFKGRGPGPTLIDNTAEGDEGLGLT
jgi:hypothetical protein